MILRRLAIWLAVTLALAGLLVRVDELRVAAPDGGANERSAVAAPTYNDTRPVGRNGYLCVWGSKGRLNNKILHNLVGIYMAHRLNRTLLVDDEVSVYYDVDRLSLTTYPDAGHRVAMSILDSPHGRTCGNPSQVSPYNLNRALMIPERIDQYGAQTSGREVASIDNSDAWYWLGRPPESVYAAFFKGLVPRKVYSDKVDSFLADKGLGDRAYNALHLRYYEGNCGRYDADLCCPVLDRVYEILLERGGCILDPIFVANDGQCPPDVLKSYAVDSASNANGTAASMNQAIVMGYDGPCSGTECAVLDFELCVRSSGVFVGNMKSSGDLNIREWRLARYGMEGRTSVLSRDAEMKAWEGKHEYVTRYVMGHWRWRPDCGAVSPRERGSKPCA